MWQPRIFQLSLRGFRSVPYSIKGRCLPCCRGVGRNNRGEFCACLEVESASYSQTLNNLMNAWLRRTIETEILVKLSFFFISCYSAVSNFSSRIFLIALSCANIFSFNLLSHCELQHLKRHVPFQIIPAHVTNVSTMIFFFIFRWP